ncbi:MAG: thiamine-phosphate kinase, partial [Candidatus Eremiobacteraeota bacterium]|nr:thiamine-phosphate kinase [Candidatus Eremiobacteraeota bacterium]
MNEDDLVDALAALVHRPSNRILVGIGDDAAVWQPSRAHRSVISTDALVEGVHFTCDTLSPTEIGYRAMASNISDIAAMGARPRLATVALALPEGWTHDRVLEMYRGMLACCDEAGVAIAGGDLTRGPILGIVITVVGEVRPSNLTLRSGARPGDVLCVTGPLGASRAGLLLASHPKALSGELHDQAVRAHRTPHARWREGAWLGSRRSVHAMMDLSDGLSTDLARLCASSKCAAVV